MTHPTARKNDFGRVRQTGTQPQTHVISERMKTLKPIKYLPVIALATLLGACASPTPHDLNTAEVRALPQHGTEFQKALHHDYVVLAQSELDQGDRGTTTVYDTKARQVSAGVTVLPTRMDERSLPAENVAELTEARAKLMRVLDAGGATRATDSTSRAQTQFDCWMEQQEENYSFQKADRALCRDGFLSAIGQASDIVFAVAAPAPKVAAPVAPTKLLDIATYTIYFDHNSSTLGAAAMAMNDEIASRIKSSHATSVTVNGYADRSGDVEYNRLLAERRASTVAAALEHTGIKPMVGSESFGENRLAVQTADDVKEWKNRRVVVTLKK